MTVTRSQAVFGQFAPGTSFDEAPIGSRRIDGVRNIRQALASPHSGFFYRFVAAFTLKRGAPTPTRDALTA